MKKYLTAGILSFLLVLSLSSIGRPETVEITDRDILELKVHIANTCIETKQNEQCMFDPSPEVLQRVDDYWNQFGIDLEFLHSRYYVNTFNYTIYVPENWAQFLVTMNLIDEELEYVEADINWFNTAIKSDGDTGYSRFVGYGLPYIDFLITDAVVFQDDTEDRQVSLIIHELGHVFNLEHVDNINNLMYPKLTADPSDVLTADQVIAARNHIKTRILNEQEGIRRPTDTLIPNGQSQLRHEHSH